MEGINITLDGEEVEIEWIFETKPFDRIRRITGYLVGTLDRFNDAKRKEVEERVKHGIDSIQSDMDDVCLTDEELANL